jgi:sugar lactone lactonase YvrE
VVNLASNTALVAIDVRTANVSVLAPTPKTWPIGLPDGIASDGHGHLYFADYFGHVVDRVDLADGSLHQIAGDPSLSGSRDGIGSAAQFSYPEGVALVGDTLYVADSGYSTIRAVRVSDGTVTTFAGVAGWPGGSSDGVGSAARFNNPTALVSDGNGGLFVADTDNGVIRRIDIASAAVTTIVGVSGQNGVLTGDLPARLNHPRGIAILPGGRLAISDEQAILIWR